MFDLEEGEETASQETVEETPAAEEPAAETQETAETQEQEETPVDPFSETDKEALDHILKTKLPDAEELKDGKYFKLTREQLLALPPEALKAVHNMQAAFTRKTQELAKSRKDVVEKNEQTLKEIKEQRAAFEESRSRFLKALQSQGVTAATADKAPTLDPTKDPSIFSDPVKLQQYIEEQIGIKVAKSHREVLKPITEETTKEQKRMEFAKFVREHEDFEQRKPRIKELLAQNTSWTLNQAYDFAKNEYDGAVARKELEKVNALQAQRARSAAAQGKPGAAGATTALSMPAGLKGAARVAWLAAHPDYRYENDPAVKRRK